MKLWVTEKVMSYWLVQSSDINYTSEDFFPSLKREKLAANFSATYTVYKSCINVLLRQGNKQVH